MESSIDGDIRLSVGVDTSEAEKDIKNIGKAVQDILKSIEKGTGDLSSRFDTLNNAVVGIASSLDEMKGYIANFSNIQFPVEQLNKVIESISAINNQAGSTEQEVEKANGSAVKLSDTITKIGQTKINLGAEDLQSRLEAAEQEYQRLETLYNDAKANNTPLEKRSDIVTEWTKVADEVDRLEQALETAKTTMTSFDNSSGEVSTKMLNLQANVNKAESAVIALEQKLAQMYLTKIPTQEFEVLLQEIEKTRLEADLGFSSADKKLIQLQSQERKMIEEGKAFKDVTQTAGYQNLVNQLQVANGKLAEARQKLEERTQAENQDTDAINRNTEAVIRNNRARNGGTGENTGGGTVGDTKQPESRLARVANTVGRGTLAIKGFTSTLSRYFGRLSGLVNKSNKDVDKNFKDINKTIRRSITNVLKYALGIRSIYFAFNKIRRAGIESFKSLVKSSDEVNRTISETYSAFVNLKNAIGPAFQPLVSALAPVFTRLADSLTNATYRLGEFFAALTGQSYVYKAIKVQKDYAKSLDKTSDKLQENLASFDKLNVLSDKNETSEDDSVQYETTPLSDTFSTLKSLIEGQDWDGLGAYIAQKINGAIQKINDAVSWENVGEKLTGTVTAFTTTVNSLVDNIDWALLGNTVGEGVNTIVNTFNLLLTGVNFRKIGRSLATSLNNAITTINWNNLGKMLGNWFMKSWKTFLGFIETLDFKSVGDALANGINGFFDTFDLSTITLSISTLINGIAEALETFINETDWESIYDNIGKGIKTFFDNTKIGDFLVSATKFVSKIFGAISTVVTETDWSKIGYEIGYALQKAPWEEIADNVAKAAGGAVGGVVGLVLGFIEGLFGSDGQSTLDQELQADKYLEMAGDSIAGAIILGIADGINKFIYKVFNALSEGFWKALGAWDIEQSIEKWFEEKVWQPLFDAMGFGKNGGFWIDKIREAGGNIGQGILDGIGQSFYNIGAWIKKKIIDPWITSFKQLFGIHSPSKVMAELGGYISLGFLEGITDKFVAVWDWIKSLPKKFKDGFSKVADAIKQPFSKIADWFKDKFQKAWEGVKNVFSAGGKVFDGIKEGIANVFKTVVNTLIRGINTIIAIPFNNINGMLNTIRNISVFGAKPFEGFWGENPLPVPQIPELATGTVVPANFGKFPAILGDNTKEPEVVSPVSTIEQAVENVLRRTGFFGDGNIEINLNVDGKVLYSVIVNQDQIDKKRHGGRSRLGTV